MPRRKAVAVSRNYPALTSPESGGFIDGARSRFGSAVELFFGRSCDAMTPLCLVCEEPMKKQGRTLRCEPCRQIIIYFSVSEEPPYYAGAQGALVVTSRRARPRELCQLLRCGAWLGVRARKRCERGEQPSHDDHSRDVWPLPCDVLRHGYGARPRAYDVVLLSKTLDVSSLVVWLVSPPCRVGLVSDCRMTCLQNVDK
jgi:hypothetical protein